MKAFPRERFSAEVALSPRQDALRQADGQRPAHDRAGRQGPHLDYPAVVDAAC